MKSSASSLWKFCFLGVVMLSSCQESQPPKKSGNTPKADAPATSDASSTLPPAPAVDEGTLKIQISQANLDAAVSRAQNQKLCERLVRLTQECVSMARLIPLYSEERSGCTQTGTTGAEQSKGFKAHVANEGQFTLRADNYTTTSFQGGTSNPVTWTRLAGSVSVDAPRFSSLSSIHLVNSSGTPAANQQVKLTYNDSEIFSGTTNSNGTLALSTSLEKLQGESCSVSADEIQKLLDDGKSSVQTSNIPQPQSYDSLSSEIRTQKLQADASHALAQAKIERDRTLILDAELRVNNGIGCAANVKIQSLEILLKGSHAANRVVQGPQEGRPYGPTTDKDAPLESVTGNPSKLVIQLGPNLTYTIANEDSENRLLPAGSTVSLAEAVGKSAFELSQISVQKAGSKLAWTRVGSTYGCGFFNTCQRWQQEEQSIYTLDAMQIKINGNLYFEKSNIGKVLSSADGLVWTEDLKSNPSYISQMQRTDCKAQ